MWARFENSLNNPFEFDRFIEDMRRQSENKKQYPDDDNAMSKQQEFGTGAREDSSGQVDMYSSAQEKDVDSETRENDCRK